MKEKTLSPRYGRTPQTARASVRAVEELPAVGEDPQQQLQREDRCEEAFDEPAPGERLKEVGGFGERCFDRGFKHFKQSRFYLDIFWSGSTNVVSRHHFCHKSDPNHPNKPGNWKYSGSGALRCVRFQSQFTPIITVFLGKQKMNEWQRPNFVI